MSNAFPMGATVPDPANPGMLKWEQVLGLTKREYAAIAIMAGLVANPDRNGGVGAFARDSLMFADALLAELAK